MRLAERLGMNLHISALRDRVTRLAERFPSEGAICLEDWLLDVANSRGARFVMRHPPAASDFVPPDRSTLSNEELIVAILLPHNLDRPQMIRAAAQLISQSDVDPDQILFLARRERAERVLADLSRSATRIDPAHPSWSVLARGLADVLPLKSPILHWTRLALPVPDQRGCNAQSWRLVA